MQQIVSYESFWIQNIVKNMWQLISQVHYLIQKFQIVHADAISSLSRYVTCLEFCFREADVLDAGDEGQGLAVGEVLLLQPLLVTEVLHLGRGLQLAWPHQVRDQVEPERDPPAPELILHPCLESWMGNVMRSEIEADGEWSMCRVMAIIISSSVMIPAQHNPYTAGLATIVKTCIFYLNISQIFLNSWTL